MKKLLVVLLALTFVVAMATAAFAVTTSSVDGKVEWTLTSGDQFGGSVDGKIIFDLGKDFGEGYSAGLKIKIDPTNDNNSDELKFDGDGWIQMVKDLYTVKFQTGGLGGNAANELGVGYDMAGNPGLQVTSDKLMDGLALTLVLNDNALTPGPEESPNFYNYLLKAVYSADALTVGFGYQAHSQPAAITDSTAKDAMAFWAGYKLGDALSFGLEYGSRPNENGIDADGNLVEGSTAILIKADYTAGALTVNGKVLMTTGSYYLIDPDDKGSTSAWNFFKYGVAKDLVTNVDPEDGTGVAGTALKIDVAYQITDALSASVTVEDILAGAVIGTTGVELGDKQLLSYKLAVTDKLSDAISVTGSYAGYGDYSEIVLSATDTLAAGLVGSLELKSASTVGSDAVNTYTVKLTATL